MRRVSLYMLAILAVLAVGCATRPPVAAPQQPDGRSGVEPSRVEPSQAPSGGTAANPANPPAGTSEPALAPSGEPFRPALVQVTYNEARQEEMPGVGTVYVVESMAHLHAGVVHSENVQWRIYPTSPGPDGTSAPLGILLPHLVDGTWVLDWNDPPASPVRLTLYAEVGPAVPDDPSFRRENGKRWAILTAVLLKGVTLGPGDDTGVLSSPPPDVAALNEVVSTFIALTAKGDYQSAMQFLDPASFGPDPEHGKQGLAALQGQTRPGLAEILGAQVWAGRKFPSCMCRVRDVTEVVVKLSDGSRSSFWARRDANSEWRLIWSPR